MSVACGGQSQHATVGSHRQQERIWEAELDAKTAKAYTNVDDDEVIEDIDDARTKGQLTERPEKLTKGQENIEAMVQELTQGISDKLDQVGLTDDQRQKLDTFDSGEFMKELGWTTVKGVLSLVPGLGPIIATYEIAETTLQEFWNQTNGSLAERLKQVKQAVVEKVRTGSEDRPDRVKSRSE